MASSILDPAMPVDVEYDCRGKRVVKHFDDANVAKRFFAMKEKEGKSPSVRKPADAVTAAVADAAAPPPAAPKPKATTSKAAKPAAPPAAPKLPGVNATAATRAYHAGKLLAQRGHDQGVPAALVAAVDAAYGRKPNLVQSSYDAQTAWQAVRGYLEGLAAAK